MASFWLDQVCSCMTLFSGVFICMTLFSTAVTYFAAFIYEILHVSGSPAQWNQSLASTSRSTTLGYCSTYSADLTSNIVARDWWTLILSCFCWCGRRLAHPTLQWECKATWNNCGRLLRDSRSEPMQRYFHGQYRAARLSRSTQVKRSVDLEMISTGGNFLLVYSIVLAMVLRPEYQPLYVFCM